jgi:hypothetical protein
VTRRSHHADDWCGAAAALSVAPSRDLAHLTLDLPVTVRDQLDRLAWHYDCGVTELVEKLAAAAEKHVEAKLSGKALEVYRAAGLYEA